jgi:hypothetical protein
VSDTFDSDELVDLHDGLDDSLDERCDDCGELWDECECVEEDDDY